MKVSEHGEVRNYTTKRIIKGCEKKNGYVEYCLQYQGKRKYKLIHRMVAELYIPNYDNLPQVNHKDGNKLNNNVENLEWVTSKTNNIHAWENKLNHAHILRPVKQFSLEHKFIKEFPSVADAKRETGATKIREVANGIRKTSGGYIWEWVEDFIPQDIGVAKKVAMLNENKEILQIFDSVSEASRKTGANRVGISQACLGKQKTCFNYYWSFIDDDIVQ